VQICVYMATGTDQENRAYWYLVRRGPMKVLLHRYQTILLLLITNQTVVATLTSMTRQSIEPWTLHRVTTHSGARRGFADRTDAVRDVQNQYFSLRFLIFPVLRLAIMQICCRIYYMAALDVSVLKRGCPEHRLFVCVFVCSNRSVKFCV